MGRSRHSQEKTHNETALENMISSLYGDHLQFWFNQLKPLIIENSQLQGHVGFSAREAINYGIFYACRAWVNPQFKESYSFEYALTNRNGEGFEIVPLCPDNPDLETRLIRVTANLGELDIEIYEAKRFLGSLLQFPAPESVYQDILGTILFDQLAQPFHVLDQKRANITGKWNAHYQIALDTFTKEHDFIVNQMCSRILTNLMTADMLRKG